MPLDRTWYGAFAAVGLLAACAAEPAPQLTQATWCDGFEQERLSPVARLSGRNRERLVAAQRVVAPALGSTRAVSGLSLLGGYQEEMQRARPDTLTAATYLAAAGGVPVTPPLVGTVNALLCVTATAPRVRAIAAAAEGMQREMLAQAGG